MASVVYVVHTNTRKSRNAFISCRYNFNKFNHLKCDVYLNYIKLISYLLENTKRTHYKKNKLMLDMEKNLYLL